jgi:hypothetical protein
MTGAGIIRHAREAGISLHVEEGRIKARPARLLAPDLADLIRSNREAVIAAIAFPCIDCGTGLEEGVLLCHECLSKRQGWRKVVPFDPDHRRRVEAALATAACSSCGWSWSAVNARGDAWCAACLEIAAGRQPRCLRCNGTAWTDAGGRKTCGTCQPTPPSSLADEEAPR